MIDEGKYVEIVRVNGPCLPATVAKELKSSILITSAILSDLVSRKKIFLSKLKVGSSPLYYVEGQQSRLMQWADQLGEKDRRTYDLLKENKVLRESVCDPLTRVSLAKLKDFAIPLTVTTNNEKEMFYKWFLSSTDEASAYISQILDTAQAARVPAVAESLEVQTETKQIVQEKPVPAAGPEKEETTLSYSQEPIEAELQAQPYQAPAAAPSETSISQPLHSAHELQPVSSQETIVSSPSPASVSEEEGVETEPPSFEEELQESEPVRQVKPKIVKAEQKEEPKEEEKEEVKNKENVRHEEGVKSEEKQKELEQIQEEAELKDINDDLYESVLKLFSDKSVEVKHAEVVRKGREINLVVDVPSVVGRLRYFCKALHKKRSNEKDMSAAFLEGELQKLPLLFLHTGQLTKKGKEMSERKEYRNLMVLEIDHGS